MKEWIEKIGFNNRPLCLLGLAYFLVCFIHGILLSTKDALVVTAPGAGAQVIPVIHLGVLLPILVLFTYFYQKSLKHYSLIQVIRAIFIFFISAFAIFGFILFPLREMIHPSLAGYDNHSHLIQAFIGFFRCWSYSLFYVVAELWGGIINSVLFWGFVNEIYRIKQAQKNFGPLQICGNIGGIISGFLVMTLSSMAASSSVVLYMGMICLTSLIIIYILSYLTKTTFTKKEYPSLHLPGFTQKKSEKTNSSFFKDRYLLCMGIMVWGFNFAMNSTILVWKSVLGQAFQSHQQITHLMGICLIFTGILSLILAFALPWILKNVSWKRTALFAPTVFLLVTISFYSLWLAGHLNYAVIAGCLVFILGRATKYTTFDSTKELAYLPLSVQRRVQGKAVIDGVGSRFGKVGGSIIVKGVMLTGGSLASATPLIGIGVMGVIAAWILATRDLARQTKGLLQQA